MPDISYSITTTTFPGTVQTVMIQSGVSASISPNPGVFVELRVSQMLGVNDAAAASGAGTGPGTRPMKKGEIQQALRILEEALIGDPNVYQ